MTSSAGLRPRRNRSIRLPSPAPRTFEFGPYGTPVLDGFNTGASQSVNARTGWDTNLVFSSETTMATDAVPSYAGGINPVSYGNAWGTAFEADQECWTVVGSLFNDIFLYVRLVQIAPFAPSGYELGWTASTGAITVSPMTGGVGGPIGAGATQLFKAGDGLGFVAHGTLFEVWWKNGTAAWAKVYTTPNDTTWNARAQVGVELSGAARIDAFGGGSLNQNSLGRMHTIHRPWAGRS